VPRESVRINVASEFPIEVGARFFATIAHPEDRNERERYHFALCHLCVLARAKSDLDFATSLLPIIPAIFVSSDHARLQTLKRGNKKLRHRLATAKFLVMPHFRERKLEPLQVEKDRELIVPTLNKMTLVAMKELGWTAKPKSVPTFKSKIWAPSRPVVHAAAAYVLWCHHAKRTIPVEHLFMTCLGDPPTIAGLMQKSEAFRLMLPNIEQFKIKEEETIQILAEEKSLELPGSQPEA
jgi:hypothetical protein